MAEPNPPPLVERRSPKPAVSMADPAARFHHRPVLLDAVVDALDAVPPGVVVDATLGGGGHAEAILSARPDVAIHAFDRDPAAREAAAERLARFDDRVHVHAARFDRCREVLTAIGIEVISGFLMDLGVSSPQLDDPARGFSYRLDGPLDMRMDPTSTTTAADVVNTYPLDELIDVIRSYGDERHAARIARAIVAARPLTRTVELADVVRDAVPAAARRQTGHPAKRTFQAIRIEVNDELAILGDALDQLIGLLAAGGTGLVLTYHSGEDRIVKAHMRHWVTADDLPGMPRRSEFVWAFRGARTPADSEVATNPRARSARLRGITRSEAA